MPLNVLSEKLHTSVLSSEREKSDFSPVFQYFDPQMRVRGEVGVGDNFGVVGKFIGLPTFVIVVH